MTGTSGGTPRVLMSAANYARQIGVTHPSITQAIARGDIVPLDNGLIDVEQANSTYGRKRAQRAALRASSAEGVEKRERALLQRTIAQMAMMQKRAEELRDAVVPRDASQADINTMTTDVRARVTFADGSGASAWTAAAKAMVLADLGELQDEAFRVTRR